MVDANTAGGALGGRTALVTGAGSGIGAAIAAALSGAGARVVCSGRSSARLEKVVAGLPGEALAFTLDVAVPEVAARIAALPESWRGIDVLVNNAGHDRGGRQPFADGDVEDWAAIIDTNVSGMMRVTHALLPTLLARPAAHVVNIGSTAGIECYTGGAAYVASKHAVHGLTESLRQDLAASRVRVSEVMPGMVKTSFAYARWPDDKARADSFYAEHPCIAPADIARAVLYVLCEPPGVEIASLVIRPKGEA